MSPDKQLTEDMIVLTEEEAKLFPLTAENERLKAENEKLRRVAGNARQVVNQTRGKAPYAISDDRTKREYWSIPKSHIDSLEAALDKAKEAETDVRRHCLMSSNEVDRDKFLSMARRIHDRLVELDKSREAIDITGFDKDVYGQLTEFISRYSQQPEVLKK